MINILIKRQTSFTDIEEEKNKAVAKNTILKLGANSKNDLELEIIFISPEDIRNLNKEYRGNNKPTDVLSFPQTHFKQSKLNILGSIVICPEIAREREEPIEELIKHGILHLYGFDHETDEAKWDEAAKIINCNF
jgi:probable rRNA maturation factor